MAKLTRALNIDNALGETLRSIRTYGLVRTASVIKSRLTDYLFDLRYGTDTVQTAELDELDIPYDSRRSGQRYQPTGAVAFRKIMSLLALREPGGAFVDFGSGKGRVLMLAARFPFKRVVGIEFSPALCEVTRRNVARFRAKVPGSAPIDVHEMDVAAYPLAGDETVFYFFHPFGEDIFRRVLANIRASLETKPREAWVVYYLPKSRTVIEEGKVFKLHSMSVVGGYECAIYRFSPGGAA